MSIILILVIWGSTIKGEPIANDLMAWYARQGISVIVEDIQYKSLPGDSCKEPYWWATIPERSHNYVYLIDMPCLFYGKYVGVATISGNLGMVRLGQGFSYVLVHEVAHMMGAHDRYLSYDIMSIWADRAYAQDSISPTTWQELGGQIVWLPYIR